MQITSLSLRNFRCFEKLDLVFNAPIVLLEGCNGSGKTSILEALHYACFMRSFRALTPAHMIQFSAQAFSVKIGGITDGMPWEMAVGTSAQKRVVKIDNKAVTKRADILERYRVLTITETDLALIAGYPEQRRHFLDTILLLIDAEHGETIRTYEKILKQRTALFFHHTFDTRAHEVWTIKLQEYSNVIMEKRRLLVKKLETHVQNLLKRCDLPDDIYFEYQAHEFNEGLLPKEIEARRTLFGAHLDDLIIMYQGTQARRFASRGQQKLLVILLKIAAHQIINRPALFLLDDIMTDFDRVRLAQIIELLIQEQRPLIFTCPMENSTLNGLLQRYAPQKIALPTNHFLNNEPSKVKELSEYF